MSHDYSLTINTTPSLIVTRLLEILLPAALHPFILLVTVLVHSRRRTRAAIIRSLDTLAFLHQYSLDMGEELDQGIELFDREGDALTIRDTSASAEDTVAIDSDPPIAPAP